MTGKKIVILKSIVVLALVLTVMGVYARPGCAQLSWGKSILFTVPKRPARVIVFPTKYTIGLLKMTPVAGAKGPDLAVSASGKVTVPAGYISLLVAEHQLFAHPDLIDGFAPDAFDSIQLTAVVIDDAEEGQVDKVLAKIGHLKELREVILDRSDVADSGVAYLASLPNLQRLSMFSTSFSGTALKQLSTLQHLENLRLSQNTLKQDNLKYLADMRALNFLALARCNLKASALQEISKCTGLKSLDISGNPDLDDQSLKCLASLKKLTCLSTAKTRVTLKGIMQLKGVPLAVLMCSDRQFTAAEVKILTSAFPGLIVSQKTFVRPVDGDTRTLFAPRH